MRSTEAYACLATLGAPVFSTGEAAVAWGAELPAAAKTLRRLADAGLVRRLRRGVWLVGSGPADPADVLPALTWPYPSYLSSWSALFAHGMIDQIPRSIHAASLGRGQTVDTADARFEIHHLHPDVFGGHTGQTGVRAGLATPEKALFDTVYLLAARSATVTLPEIELPDGFEGAEVERWVARIPSARLASIVSRRLDDLCQGPVVAEHEPLRRHGEVVARAVPHPRRRRPPEGRADAGRDGAADVEAAALAGVAGWTEGREVAKVVVVPGRIVSVVLTKRA